MDGSFWIPYPPRGLVSTGVFSAWLKSWKIYIVSEFTQAVFRPRVLNLRSFCLQGTLESLEILLVITIRVASCGQKPGNLLNIIQCSGQFPQSGIVSLEVLTVPLMGNPALDENWKRCVIVCVAITKCELTEDWWHNKLSVRVWRFSPTLNHSTHQLLLVDDRRQHDDAARAVSRVSSCPPQIPSYSLRHLSTDIECPPRPTIPKACGLHFTSGL